MFNRIRRYPVKRFLSCLLCFLCVVHSEIAGRRGHSLCRQRGFPIFMTGKRARGFPRCGLYLRRSLEQVPQTAPRAPHRMPGIPTLYGMPARAASWKSHHVLHPNLWYNDAMQSEKSSEMGFAVIDQGDWNKTGAAAQCRSCFTLFLTAAFGVFCRFFCLMNGSE